MENTNINIYPEKNRGVIVRWVVEYIDKNGERQKVFKESEEKALKFKSELENVKDEELAELVSKDGGLIHGDKPSSVGAVGSGEITSKSTTDDYIKMTRQAISRAWMYRKFYGESVEDEISKPIKRHRTLPITNIDVNFLGRKINEVDKSSEALGDIYTQSTDPIDFENKAKLAGYDSEEIKVRQQRFFRKTSEEQKKTHNSKIPLEEIDIVEDVLVDKKHKDKDIIMKTKDEEIERNYSIPYYDQLKEKNPLIARKLIYLIDIIKRDEVKQKDKAAIIWQFLNGVGVNDLRPEDKDYIIKFLQNGK